MRIYRTLFIRPLFVSRASPVCCVSDGHVYECLAGFGHGPLDKPAGRYMGDTSTLFVLELYELYRNTGNTSFMTSVWPGAVKAIHWCSFPSLYYGLFPYNP